MKIQKKLKNKIKILKKRIPKIKLPYINTLTKISKKLTSKINKISFYKILYLFPIIDFLTSYFVWQGVNIWLGSIIKGLLIIYALIKILRHKESYNLALLLIGYLFTEIIYIFQAKLSIITNLSLLMKIFFFPIILLYFKNQKESKIDDTFLTKIFYTYLLLLILPYFFGLGHNLSEFYPNKSAYLSYFYSGNELSATLLCLLPVVLKKLKNHHNNFAKILGALLIVLGFALLKTKTLIIGFMLSIIYLLWKDRKKKTNYKIVLPIFIIIASILTLTLKNNFNVALKYYEIDEVNEVFSLKFVDRVLLSSRLSSLKETNDIYLSSSKREQVFGLGSMREIKDIEMDFFDIFYTIGILGIIIYLIIIIYALRKIKITGIYRFSFYLTIVTSFLTGHILTSPMVSIWLATLVLGSKNNIEKKKILMVANMYPSKKNKHYGSFVKNMTNSLKDLDYDVELSTMSKHNHKLTKLIAYIKFYSKTWFKATFKSYDYIYVHFISHSTTPVLFGYTWSSKTKLILNAHGNDIVNDYNFEEKNIIKSRKYIEKADLVVVPSTYFKKCLISNYNIEEEKVIIYPSGGVNLEKFKQLNKIECKKQLSLNLNTTYIGFVSRLEKNKGYDTLLEAIYMLKEEPFMANTKIIVIGNGLEQKNFKYLIKKYHLEDFIIEKNFVYQKDLVLYYNAFDLFVFPTKRKSESLGLVGLEAMACQTFTIGCDLYGPSEYLINEENSLTYKNTKTGKELARLIRKYFNMSEAEKELITKKAYETAKKFDEKKISEKLKDIFGE